MNQAGGKKKHLRGEPKTGKTRILVAPLDWGLGHATRCIPLIRELLARDCDVWLAGEGTQEELLRTEFPGLPFLHLPGYRIRYARTKWGLIWKMIVQGPKMRRAILNEQHWLKTLVANHGFDAVISDNRYGLSHPGIPCIFITHQLLIKSMAGKWTEWVLQKRNYGFIHRFTECWVPDYEHAPFLAGELSHPAKRPGTPLRYIGPLSRFQQETTVPEKSDHLLILLSGPEPQRSILENKILTEVARYRHTATIVRGLPGTGSLVPSTNMIQVFNHLPAKELGIEMAKADYIISRSGYSTVMDIMALQKKSILIPTPGQTEQEYLGRYLEETGSIVCLSQDLFSLAAALQKAKAHSYRLPERQNSDRLQQAIAGLLTLINKRNYSPVDLG